ncbi:hypothetical protein GJAV_G00175100 [Gymnothorax javanicus]|nr:hypothetical protein GJAV_G00175100 [Gymnothorax javanicus]
MLDRHQRIYHRDQATIFPRNRRYPALNLLRISYFKMAYNRKYGVHDVITLLDDHGDDSDLDILSDDGDDDENFQPDSQSGESEDETDDDSFSESDDEPLSNLAAKQKTKGRAKDCGTKTDYTWCKRPFTPPDDVAFTGEKNDPLPDDADTRTPFMYFKQFVTDEMLQHVATETNRYSVEKSGQSINTSAKEIQQLLGMYLFMGLAQMPNRRSYWETETRYRPVADVMPRNRSEKLLSFLHFQDNNAKNDTKLDKVWKLRPWLDALRQNFLSVTPEEHNSVDEMMIPFKGRSHLRVYMPAKPHKWGFKMWGRAGTSAFLYDFDVYQPTEDETGLGASAGVVYRLASTLPRGKSHKVFADKYFTSLPLIQKLRQQGIHYVGTVRANRIKNCKLMEEKDLKKQGRGTCDYKVEADLNVAMVRWYDNRVVNLLSSFVGIEPVTMARRWDRQKKEHIEVPKPAIVDIYNKFMGGIDLLDMIVAMYKYNLRSHRWYLYIFWHTVSIAVANSWILYRRHQSQQNIPAKNVLPLRRFQALVADAATRAGPGKRMRGRPSVEDTPPAAKPRKRPTGIRAPDVQKDCYNHFPKWVPTRQRCKLCRDTPHFSYVTCNKCKVHLCLNKERNCFIDYHL